MESRCKGKGYAIRAGSHLLPTNHPILFKRIRRKKCCLNLQKIILRDIFKAIPCQRSPSQFKVDSCVTTSGGPRPPIISAVAGLESERRFICGVFFTLGKLVGGWASANRSEPGVDTTSTPFPYILKPSDTKFLYSPLPKVLYPTVI